MLLLAIGLVQTEWGQNWLVHSVTARLSRDLRSRIEIKHVSIGFFNRLNLEGVLLEDQRRDTLLYAGALRVRITDWFILKDKADIKYIGLENAVIKLQRADSVWNYRYLEDYFASGPSTGKKKEAGIHFNLKKVELKNVSFLQKDAWVGADMEVRVGYLEMDARNITLTGREVDIASLSLTRPYFRMYDYTGNRPDSLRKKRKPRPAPLPGVLQWNPQNWKVAVDRLKIENGTFKNDIQTERDLYTYFDDRHLEFGVINGRITHFRWRQDTITAHIDLATKERSGFAVQSLKADYRFFPTMMEFSKLYLKTNNSELGDYYAMKFGHIDSMKNYLHAVTMVANFRNSRVTSGDIAFFAPQLKDWNRTFTLNGRAKGTVDDFSARNLTVQAGPNTYINGDLDMIGLPDVNTTYVNLKANQFRTTYADAVSFVPQIRNVTTPDLKSLKSLSFTGTFTGFFNDFVTYGRVQSDLGTLVTDLNMKFPSGAPPRYSGTLSTSDFQLGRFLGNSQLGLLAFDGKVAGKGFDWKDLDVNIDGTIRKLHYDRYTYQNIKAKGRLNNGLLDGDFILKDPNADLHLAGLINFRDKMPRFDAHADISYLNLKALQLSREELVLKGVFDLNFTGKTLSDFSGSARIGTATLLQNGRRLSFDSLSIASYTHNGVKTLQVSSNELDANLTGNFDLQALPDAFQLFLNRYYPSYIKPPRKAVHPQSFTFDIKTREVEDYVKLLDSRLSGFDFSHLSGSIDIATNSLNVVATVPQFAFRQYRFSDVDLKADGNLDRLVVTGQVNDAVVTDSLRFPQTNLRLQARNDISDISITTTANQTINQANLDAQVQTFANGVKLRLNPSFFVLNGKTWNIEQGGELDFRQNTMVHGQVVLRETDQEIRLSTQPSGIGSWNDLLVSLRNINLGDLMPIFLPRERIEGLLSGDIQVEDPQNRMNVTADLRTEQLRYDQDSIGQVRAGLFYNNQTGLLTGDGRNADPDHQILFDLALDFKDSTNAHRDRISIQPINYPVKILERFIGFLFSDLRGTVTGKLDILGEGANRDYVGRGQLKNAGMKVNFTQVFYTIEDTEIELKADEINFGTMKLHDRLGNTAQVQGKIKHRSFNHMDFDLVAKVVSRQMELLHTTYNDNQDFYGRAMGTGTLVLVGPQEDMLMNIDVSASETDSSYITLPPSRSRESGLAEFMVEKKYGQEMTGERYKSGGTKMTYMVSMTANPMVNMEVILDEQTADIIKGRGSGNLQITAGTNEPLQLRGRFDLRDGSYTYSFQSFIKKPLYLRPGANNYIEWKGDPYGATMHVEAVYRADNVSFAPLVSGLALDKTLNTYRGDVNVILVMTDELFKPTLNFKLELLDNSVLNRDPTLPYAIQQIEKNPNELSKQVSGLIVFNSFYPYEATQGAGFRPFEEFAYSTLSGLLFGEVNKRLNELLSRILGNTDLTVNFTGSVYNRNLIDQGSRGFNINQSNLNLTVSQPFFDNRFNITFGSTFDVPLQSNIQQTVQFLPDVTAEWLINKSGTIRASFFYRQNLDFIGGISAGAGLRTKRTGANISYRREYDTITEFFFGRRRKKQLPVVPQTEKPFEMPENK
ncbi:translocation/assembly module TamB domain-containing protein [Paraflavisolibacter sp. H34]|uniref:translocation/assembly module TamB domain-containing protein n=1 Tax=Huijunlia imazamoxiresistens TaxID=3127457 RepID=UPI003019C816